MLHFSTTDFPWEQEGFYVLLTFQNKDTFVLPYINEAEGNVFQEILYISVSEGAVCSSNHFAHGAWTVNRFEAICTHINF